MGNEWALGVEITLRSDRSDLYIPRVLVRVMADGARPHMSAKITPERNGRAAKCEGLGGPADKAKAAEIQGEVFKSQGYVLRPGG